MKELNMKPPSGTRDFLPGEVKKREWAFGTIKGVFESFGFLPIDTPAFERLETLMGKYGEEGEKLIFKILKRGDRADSGETDLALRYDLTVPLVRFFAEHQERLPRPFRRYQMSPVWRADRPGKGRFREFYQCDVDVIGSTSLLADAEVILALTRALSRLGLSGCVVNLNSRKVLAGLLEVYGVPQEQRQSTLIALDKLDKIGASGVIQELKSSSLPEAAVNRIEDDLLEGAAPRDRIEASLTGRQGLREVDEVISLVKPLLKEGAIKFSPFLARGLDYYTGPIFEITLDGAPGAIASGGRYDDLIGGITGKQVPACGGSLGIDRILSTLLADEQNKKDTPSPQVFVTVWDSASRAEALRIATELRDAGMTAEIYLEEGKIGKQIRLASERGARFCLFYGPDEQTRGEVTLKELSTGEQTSAKRESIVHILKTLTSG